MQKASEGNKDFEKLWSVDVHMAEDDLKLAVKSLVNCEARVGKSIIQNLLYMFFDPWRRQIVKYRCHVLLPALARVAIKEFKRNTFLVAITPS